MYHRVATLKSDVWDIAVSPENFEMHLKVLKSRCNVLSIDELVNNINKGKITKNTVAITFDDGYVDNYNVARPLLEKYQLPSTFFIASGYLNKQKEFWWDVLENIFLHSEKLPETFLINHNNSFNQFQLQEEANLTDSLMQKHQDWKAYEEPPPTLRSTLFYKLWEYMKFQTIEVQELVLNEIKKWAGQNTTNNTDNISMSNKELFEMLKCDLFTVGAHTVNHPALASHDFHFQLKELSENKSFLKESTGKEINYVAFPYGNFNHDSLQAVRQLGFHAAFTTAEKPVFNHSNPAMLARYQVKNWDQKSFEKKLDSWLH